MQCFSGKEDHAQQPQDVLASNIMYIPANNHTREQQHFPQQEETPVKLSISTILRFVVHVRQQKRVGQVQQQQHQDLNTVLNRNDLKEDPVDTEEQQRPPPSWIHTPEPTSQRRSTSGSLGKHDIALFWREFFARASTRKVTHSVFCGVGTVSTGNIYQTS